MTSTRRRLSDNTVATLGELLSLTRREGSFFHIGATSLVHDRDFPLGAWWEGQYKSERAAPGLGHHSSFHLMDGSNLLHVVRVEGWEVRKTQ